MRALIRFTLVLLAASFAGGSSFAGGGITIHLANDTPDSVMVSVFDKNLGRRRQRVLSGEVINGNASISISITSDSSGQGHLFWTARNLDPDMRRCGQHDKPGLNDGETVHVYADSKCAHR